MGVISALSNSELMTSQIDASLDCYIRTLPGGKQDTAVCVCPKETVADGAHLDKGRVTRG